MKQIYKGNFGFILVEQYGKMISIIIMIQKSMKLILFEI